VHLLPASEAHHHRGAGLCHDLGNPVSDLAITNRDGGTQWRPLPGSLIDWAQRQGVDRYFLAGASVRQGKGKLKPPGDADHRQGRVWGR
jgi:hypothetical protein